MCVCVCVWADGVRAHIRNDSATNWKIENKTKGILWHRSIILPFSVAFHFCFYIFVVTSLLLLCVAWQFYEARQSSVPQQPFCVCFHRRPDASRKKKWFHIKKYLFSLPPLIRYCFFLARCWLDISQSQQPTRPKNGSRPSGSHCPKTHTNGTSAIMTHIQNICIFIYRARRVT